MKRILITGGLGFIGSHTTVACLEAGYEVIIIDDLSNSKHSVLNSIESITNKKPTFYKGSILDRDFLDNVFEKTAPDAVIHFAAFKAVNESIQQPLKYYQNNVVGSLELFHVMMKYKVSSLIFSSSATVYRADQSVPFIETMERGSNHAYGQSKIMVESILETLQKNINTISLRYFNPVGAHPSGKIGESPNNIPNNLFPIINQVAIGLRPSMQVYGTDYDTKDGSAERDFIHVMDVARAHLLALKRIENNIGFTAINIGTGSPNTVLEVLSTYQVINKVVLNYQLAERREGDVSSSYADVTKAKNVLDFESEFSLEVMVRDAYRFVTNL
jgi:UDP-glucose 4-epimerase